MKQFVLAALLALTAPACVHYTILSPAEMSQMGTRKYAATPVDKATEATAAALATLGYKVTVKESGLVKTAPQTIMASASGGRGYANITEDGLAWSIAIEQSGADVIFHATPRAFRNGSEMHGDDTWVAEVMVSKFRDLWHEIDGNLGAGRP